MRFLHNGIEYELPDTWWSEAGMNAFIPHGRSYRLGVSEFPDLIPFEVIMSEVQPLIREGTHSVFKDAGIGRREGTARERVLRILGWFREDVPVEPVCVARLSTGTGYRFKLAHGAHRFYCAAAARFSHVQAVEVVDIWGNPA